MLLVIFAASAMYFGLPILNTANATTFTTATMEATVNSPPAEVQDDLIWQHNSAISDNTTVAAPTASALQAEIRENNSLAIAFASGVPGTTSTLANFPNPDASSYSILVGGFTWVAWDGTDMTATNQTTATAASNDRTVIDGLANTVTIETTAAENVSICEGVWCPNIGFTQPSDGNIATENSRLIKADARWRADTDRMYDIGDQDNGVVLHGGPCTGSLVTCVASTDATCAGWFGSLFCKVGMGTGESGAPLTVAPTISTVTNPFIARTAT
jgi:hypothetical protein